MNVLIAGDFCPQARVKELFEEGKYAEVLGSVREIVEKADFSIVNLECPVVGHASKRDSTAVGHAYKRDIFGEHPIEKKGPNLQCSEKGVEALKWAGFDCCTLANNHFLDFGAGGVSHTLEACKQHGLVRVGGGMNIAEASQTLYQKIGGKTLAVINCCEHEFSIATAATAGANPLNPVQQYYAICEARQKADYVLVIVHGGHEHWQLPSTRMQETYRFFIDAGADAVVNHHQHCFSGYETYKGKPIFYGLGNFCFDNPTINSGIWTEGYLLELQVGDSTGFRLHPYLQCQKDPCVKLQVPTFYDKRLEELNTIIADPELLRQHQDKYYQQGATKYKEMFEPLDNRFFRALRKRGWLPSLISKRRQLLAQDYIQCESHRDRLIYYLSNNKK